MLKNISTASTTAFSAKEVSRRRVLHTTLAAVATLALPSAFAPEAQATEQAKSVTAALTATRSAPFPVGYSTGSNILWSSQADVGRTLDAVVSGGGTHVRLDLMWYWLQPTDAKTFNWAPFDYIVEQALARKLEILGIIWSTPPWAALGGKSIGSTRPAKASTYGTFAGAVAAHYQGKITAYELWNEPNSNEFFAPAPDPAFYTAMVKAAYAAIKKVSPESTVIAGALGPAPANVEGLMHAAPFVQAMYAAGARTFFDALSFHPYEFNEPFPGGTVWDNAPMRQMMQIYALMRAKGDGAKKIWLTEYGAPAPTPLLPGALSEAAQAELITASIKAWGEVSYAGPLFIYTIRDGATAAESFGTVKHDFTPKLAHAAVAKLQGAGVPKRQEALAFAAHADSTLGVAVSPIFKTGTGLAQEFTLGSRYSTPQGWFSSPPAVATVARHHGVVPASTFKNGVQTMGVAGGFKIFYKAATGAHAVVGGILAGYTSKLGYPVTDEYSYGTAGDRAVDFEGGRIVWSPTTGTSVVLY